MSGLLSDSDEPTNTEYAQRRLPSRTYITKTFRAKHGSDAGQPSRFVRRVFDEATSDWDNGQSEREISVIGTTPGGRKQIRLQLVRESGLVREIQIEKIPAEGESGTAQVILKLNREQSGQLLATLRLVDALEIDGQTSVRVDDSLLRDVLSDPTAFAKLYDQSPARFREQIAADANAEDVIALERRKTVVATMRMWLDDTEAFADAKVRAGGGEKAWQQLLEDNPWVLGVGLGAQLFTSWSDSKLEQIVAGASITDAGKRVDALLKTSGLIQSVVFAEIKHHQTGLLAEEYRSGCFRPSNELAGAVVQSQQTVHRACEKLGFFLSDKSNEGERLASGAFVLKPRSYLIIGSLKEMIGAHGGPITDKLRSFELFRRNLQDPDVLTFDELVVAAERYVRIASAQV